MYSIDGEELVFQDNRLNSHSMIKQIRLSVPMKRKFMKRVLREIIELLKKIIVLIQILRILEKLKKSKKKKKRNHLTRVNYIKKLKN